MKKQTTASVFCTFLISIFAHEYLHHQHPQSQNRVASSHNSKHLSHFAQKRDGSDSEQVCGWQCPSGTDTTGKEDIQIVLNGTTNIVALLNVTASMPLAFDCNTNILLTGNGTTGNLIIFDIDGQYGVHVIGKKSPLFWVSANISYEDYINSLPSLKPVLEESLKVASKFQISTAGKDILKLIGVKTLTNFGEIIGKDVKEDLSDAIVVLFNVAKRFDKVLKGSLTGLLNEVTSTNFTVNIGLKPIIDRFEGLAYDLNEIEGGLGTLIKHHIKIDLKKILEAKSGIESLAYLLNSQAEGGLDVTAAGGYGSLERTFDIVVHLSGASVQGYSSFVRVVSLIIGASAKGNVSYGVLIDALVKYSISSKSDEKLYDQFNTSLKTLLKALNKVNTGGRIDSTVRDLKKLIKGSLVIGGVNIAEIAKLVAKNGNNVSIDLVVEVLVSLKNVVNVNQSIPTLILYILNKLNSHIGITTIINLFPSVKIDENVMSSTDDGNLLEVLWKKEKVGDLFESKFDIDKILEKLPVIGEIWIIISGSLDSQSKGSIKLNVVIKSYDAIGISKEILVIVGAALHYDLKTDVNVGVGRHGHHHVDGKHSHKHGVQEKIHHLKQ